MLDELTPPTRPEPDAATGAIIDRLDDLMQSGNLDTRGGLELALTVIRGAMKVTSNIEPRITNIEAAWLQAVRTFNKARELEESNHKLLKEILPVYNVLKWLALGLSPFLVALIWKLLTGSAEIIIK